MLPDLLTFNDGKPVVTPADWLRRREELVDAALDLVYGRIPEPEGPVRLVPLCLHALPPGRTNFRRSFRVHTPGFAAATFLLEVYTPSGKGPFPAVIFGDLCWNYLTTAVLEDLLDAGLAVLAFNRLELAADDRTDDEVCGLKAACPDADFGSIAAWAWGIQRVVDAAQQLEWIDPQKLAVTGHSRGGKAALLAGALDPRIAFVSSHQSGCLGAGSLRLTGEGSEKMADILDRFPFWFRSGLQAWVGREDELGYDGHFLKALVAPRYFLDTESEDDLWANPLGTRATQEAAQAVWSFLGAPESRARLHFRQGPHGHSPEDWKLLRDAIRDVFCSVPVTEPVP
jgi:dienelactone hydrolase